MSSPFSFECERPTAGGLLKLSVKEEGDTTVLRAKIDPSSPPFALHWGVVEVGSDGSWVALSPDQLSKETVQFGDGKAVRSPFTADGTLELKFSSNTVSKLEKLCGVLIRGAVESKEVEWLHATDGQGDLCVPLRPPPPFSVDGFIGRLAAAEKEPGMTLFRRFCLASEHLQEAIDNGPGSAAAWLSWIRLSGTKALPWYGGGNYQGKDMAHVQKHLTQNVANGACAHSGDEGSALVCHLLRLAMEYLPRGGGNGDDIRLGILKILRENGIREGHRPGIEDHFLEQWHQKLHSNTTSDDIVICEAYLHFLHTGNWDDFWKYCWDKGRLTREDLASMKAGWRNNGITGSACHLPHMIPAFQHFHWILKTTHSGQELDTAFQHARGNLDGHVQWMMDDLLQHRHEWWVPGKLVEIREAMKGHWHGTGITRDVVLLDIQLEKFFRTRVEQIDVGGMQAEDCMKVAELVLKNTLISFESPRLRSALKTLQKVLYDPHPEADRWQKQWALAADAALDCVALAAEFELDRICRLVQKPGETIGRAGKVEESYLSNFGEEVVRGHSLFAVSRFIGAAFPSVRKAAGRSSWQISAYKGSAAVVGKVVARELSAMQGEEVEGPVVVLSDLVGGLEDVPPGVVAVLCHSPVDVLSHIAIRARAQGIVLASCVAEDEWKKLKEGAVGEIRRIVVSADGSVLLEQVDEPALTETQTNGKANGGKANGHNGHAVAARRLPQTETSSKWVLKPKQYQPKLVGGKGCRLAKLAESVDAFGSGGKVGMPVRVPASLALPFGSFDRALQAASPAERERFDAAVQALEDAQKGGAVNGCGGKGGAVNGCGGVSDHSKTSAALAEIRSTVEALEGPPASLLAELKETAAGGLKEILGVEDDDAAMDRLWSAVKTVWASKWSDRAFLSRKSLGVPESDLVMATLLMRLERAEQAFVLHTANPITGDKGEVWGEVVEGLGETLVGNERGRPLAFKGCKKTGSIEILSFPSKATAWKAPDGEGGSYMARSDSNGEDLEDFAGAGLYESVSSVKCVQQPVDYSESRLTWDFEWRRKALSALLSLSLLVEEEEGGVSQDVEGCLVNGEIVLLQARTQVIHQH
uniref:Uncharacterized protein n=1 Tax=Chromera velia CCMP2878 TaxID=1169474 RepID=A0A0G4HAY6_9ALVE|eukprot:Cvel_25679.t1-p1 / transcript=Cvel_25679.t1 / gene=Cvel_25679 / organism=Chromera_velia_CCMP2878 / gene_product=Alpha-glucan water dikinase 1, chloroplastic, putative / transcript_product=Alpha-glucan water dikinase 1, chloroplastic, putative / location=Cvel_scaffold2943:16827-20658(-) / protein_length=1097 / sequence_SO=supercontig / SO=protein_coding / is_pseudo=false